jgi:hypothetical protein
VVPSPKSHNQEIGVPTVVSLNTTVRGVFPDLGEPVKSARRDIDPVVAVVVPVVVVVVVLVVVAVVVTADSTII